MLRNLHLTVRSDHYRQGEWKVTKTDEFCGSQDWRKLSKVSAQFLGGSWWMWRRAEMGTWDGRRVWHEMEEQFHIRCGTVDETWRIRCDTDDMWHIRCDTDDEMWRIKMWHRWWDATHEMWSEMDKWRDQFEGLQASCKPSVYNGVWCNSRKTSRRQMAATVIQRKSAILAVDGACIAANAMETILEYQCHEAVRWRASCPIPIAT